MSKNTQYALILAFITVVLIALFLWPGTFFIPLVVIPSVIYLAVKCLIQRSTIEEKEQYIITLEENNHLLYEENEQLRKELSKIYASRNRSRKYRNMFNDMD